MTNCIKSLNVFYLCNIYLKPERFRKSNTLDNVDFDLRKRSGLKYILQILNICLVFK